MQPTPWTRSRIDQLRVLVARMVARPGTMTCRDIAEQLGTSKNAVIGKVKRLRTEGADIPHLKAVAYLGRPQNGIRPRSPRPRKVQRLTPSCFVPVENSPVSTPPKPRRGLAPPDEPQLEPMLAMRRLTLLQLGDRMCRWPVGDPGTAGFCFCGNSTDLEQSYCPVHCRVAYYRRPV